MCRPRAAQLALFCFALLGLAVTVKVIDLYEVEDEWPVETHMQINETVTDTKRTETLQHNPIVHYTTNLTIVGKQQSVPAPETTRSRKFHHPVLARTARKINIKPSGSRSIAASKPTLPTKATHDSRMSLRSNVNETAQSNRTPNSNVTRLSFPTKAARRPRLPPKDELRPVFWSEPTIWLTLLDESAASEAGSKAFKRHMISKNLFGKVAWSDMGVMFTPDAPHDLLAWAREIGASLFPVSSLPYGAVNASRDLQRSLTKLQAWCMPSTPKLVAFMDINTIVRRDVREMVTLCGASDDAAFCGVAAGIDHPEYAIDPSLFVAYPSERHCEALRLRSGRLSKNHTNDGAKDILNEYFTYVNRTMLDTRFLHVQADARPLHSAEDSFVIQYTPDNVTTSTGPFVTNAIAELDQTVASFDSQRAGQIPKRVLYATMLTPAPKEGFTHSTTADVFKEHHMSKFLWGRIPWENQAIVYTEDAFPEFRKWLEDRGGHAIKVPPLFCENARDKRYKYQFTKLQFWNLTDWDMIVYTDLDTLITGDITKLWSSCPSGFNLCSVDEPRYFHKGFTYMNGGVLLVRPDSGYYNFLIEGRRTYKNRTLLCEQDFFNFFLTKDRYAVVDPKYNTMGFDHFRNIRFMQGKILHFDLKSVNQLHEGVTPAERDYIHKMIAKADKEALAITGPVVASEKKKRKKKKQVIINSNSHSNNYVSRKKYGTRPGLADTLRH